MTAVGDEEVVAVVDVRFDVVRKGGRLGQPGQHVEGGEAARGFLNPRAPRAATRAAKLLEELDFALEDPLVGADHLLLVLLQRRRDEPLSAGNRLLAVIVGRNGVQIRFGDLDVVAEDPVIPHLQRADARPRALALLERGDDLLAGAADAAQLVELGIDAVANVAAFAGQCAGLSIRHAVNVVANVGQIVERS